MPLEGLPKPREQKLSVLQPGSISPLSFLFLTLVHSFIIAPRGGSSFLCLLILQHPCIQHVDGSPVKHGQAQLSLQEWLYGIHQAGLPVMLQTPGNLVPQYSNRSCQGVQNNLAGAATFCWVTCVCPCSQHSSGTYKSSRINALSDSAFCIGKGNKPRAGMRPPSASSFKSRKWTW